MKLLSVFLATFVVAISLFLSGCTGDPGRDGNIYVRIDYDYYLDSWGSTAYNIRYADGTYYQVSPGTYSFNYTLDNGYMSVYNWGTFTVSANPGSSGKAFGGKGDDGTDKYLTLYFGWYSVTLNRPGSLSRTALPVDDKALKNTGKISMESFVPTVTRVDTVEGAIVKWEYTMKYSQRK